MKTKILALVLTLFSGLVYGQTVYISGPSTASVNEPETYWANWDFSPDEGEFNWWVDGGDVIYPDPDYTSTSCRVNWTTGGQGTVWYSYSTWDNWWEESFPVYVSSPMPLPDAPTINNATNVTAISFTANWNSVTSATSYQLEVSTDPTSWGNLAYHNFTVYGTSDNVTGLSGGTTYYYRVRAVNEAGMSEWTMGSLLTIPATPVVYNPSNITASSFTANWGSVTPNTDYYRLDVSTFSSFSSLLPGYNSLQVNVNQTSQSVTGLSAGTTYYYRVRAENDGLESENSDTKSVLTTPSVTSGPTTVCVSTGGHVYTTQGGMTGYSWSAPGGTITAGQGTSSATVTWNTLSSQSVSVHYVNANGASSVTPGTRSVTVNPRPNPSITGGPTVVCANTEGHVYTTQTGMTGYSWIATGGIVTAGQGTSSATVTWNTSGSQSVSVNYTNGNGCSSATPGTLPVTVNPASTPSITDGPMAVCVNTGGHVYTTQTGMTGYSWSASGGTITAGQGTNSATVTWNSSAWDISVHYTNEYGCSSVTPGIRSVTVIPRPTPSITDGPTIVCVNTGGHVYTTQTGMTGYSWSAPGGTITAGQGTSSATVTWNTSGSRSISVYYTDGNGCSSVTPGTRSVTVTSRPTPSITGGPTAACVNTGGHVYTTQTGMTGYSWSATGGTITAGQGTSSATVTWNNSGPQNASVQYTDGNGCSSVTPGTLLVTVNPQSNGGTLVPAVEAYGQASGTLSVTGITGTIQKWQQKIGFGSWTDIVQVSSALSYANITTTTSYQVIVKSGACVSATSNPVSITIYPTPSLTIVGSNVIAPGGSTKIVANPGLYSYQWYRDGLSMTDSTASTLHVTKPGGYKVSVKATSTSPTYTTGEILIASTLDQQLSPVNYIVSTSFMKEGVTEQTDLYDLQSTDYSEVIQYFDGLGRPMQTVNLGNSPAGNDVVLPVVYDEFGRNAIRYLPYSRDVRDGRYVVLPLTEQFSFYQSAAKVAHDTIPFTETIFEASPLNRILKQGSAGTSWQPDADPYSTTTDHSVKYAFETNVADEVLLWTYAPPTPTFPLGLVDAGTSVEPHYYNVNQLHKTLTKDEHQHEVIEFMDKQGRMILKKVQGPDSTWARTYYVYDDFGSLVTVLPPEAVARLSDEYHNEIDFDRETFLKSWAFRYRYDQRRRMIMKQVPGAEPIYMVYDNRDRLVLTQDGNQRIDTTWLFTKYDHLNRTILIGVYSPDSSKTQEGMQDDVNAFYINGGAWHESYDENSTTHQYSNVSFPFVPNVNDYLTVSYYDNYSFRNAWGSNYNPVANDTLSLLVNGILYEQAAAFGRVNNLVTGTKVKVLDENNTWLKSITYYDEKYRTIQTISDNYQNGLDRTSTLYDFAGKVLMTKTTHNGKRIQRRFVYDHAGRLVDTYHRVDAHEEVLLSRNDYNELGQLITKKLHSENSGTEFDQSLDHRYNIRGWLEAINDPIGSNVAKLFGMRLNYNTPSIQGGTAQYNGNISEVIWSSVGYDSTKSYGYEYDPMNRLLEAQFHNHAKPSENGRYNERIGDGTPLRKGYDLNGNILNLLRNGKKEATGQGNIDDLSYLYIGNQLHTVNDVTADATNETGFKELATKTFNAADPSTFEYKYDANGNMIKDENKGIISISYNHLNLPQKVEKESGNYIVYTYDATGRKLAQRVFTSSNAIQKQSNYSGEFFYENDTLKFINHEEGRAVMTDGSPEYQYHLKDHLGNVRLTFTTKPDEEESLATLETVHAPDEWSEFLYYDEAIIVDYSLFDHTYDGTTGSTYYSTRLTGGNTNAIYGLAKSLSVMPGDTVNMQVFAKYLDPDPNNWSAGLTDFMTAVAGGTAPQGTVVDGGSPGSMGGGTFPFAGMFDHSGEEGTAPKAYLNFIVFDRDFNPLIGESGFIRITTASKENGDNVPHDKLERTGPLVIKQPGYVYIYLSNENETPVEVFFDDFRVEHIKSPVVQMDDYYPFGLTFNSYQRENSISQDYLYNGKEMQNDLDQGWYDYGTRMFDPAIARWMAVDPAAELMKQYSPYVYSFDNPIRFIDRDGMIPQQAATDPPDLKAIMSGHKINMSGAPGSNFNTNDIPVNGRWFWRQMLKDHPQMFSADNVREISKGRAPKIDDNWIDFNPSHAVYKGDKLIHHHIDHGNMATGIPQQVHRDHFSDLHTNTGGKPRGGGGMLGKAGMALGLIGLAFDIFSDDPHSLNMQFSAGGKINTLYFDQGTDQYFEVTERGKEKDANGNEREYSVYNTYETYQYDKETKKYEGVNKTGTYRAVRVKSLDEAYQYLQQGG